MPFLKSLPENAGPPNVFKRSPEVWRPFSAMSEALMNGPSPLSPGERELILAFAAGVMGCGFVLTGHSEVAYAHGIPRGTVEALLKDIDAAPIEPKLSSLLHFVRKLAEAPETLRQEDADAVLAAGWEEAALEDAIGVTARAAFMHLLVAGHGFAPLDRDVAASHAAKRVERGYVNVYGAFRRDAP